MEVHIFINGDDNGSQILIWPAFGMYLQQFNAMVENISEAYFDLLHK